MSHENTLWAAWRKEPGRYEEELAAALRKHASAVCWGMLRRVDDDVVAEAVAEAMLKPEAFSGRSKFSTWFHGMVRNRVKSKLSKQRDEIEAGEELEGRIEGSEELLASLKVQLTAEEMELVTLLMAGHSTDEIGKIQGVSGQWVRQKREKLRERVREILGGLP